MTDLPIACTLTPDALVARRAGLLSDLLQRAEGREELPGGLRLRFAPTGETLVTIARAVEAERHFCRFLRFGITVELDGGPVFLELNGPPGTREFIALNVATSPAARDAMTRGDGVIENAASARGVNGRTEELRRNARPNCADAHPPARAMQSTDSASSAADALVRIRSGGLDEAAVKKATLSETVESELDPVQMRVN